MGRWFFKSSDDTLDSQQDDSIENSTDSNISSEIPDFNSKEEYDPGNYTVAGDFKSGVYESSTAEHYFLIQRMMLKLDRWGMIN